MKKIAIGKKLYLAFGAVLFLTIMVGVVSIYRLAGITDIFEELLTKYSKMAETAASIKIDLLTIRRHEKDFLARKDKKYIEKMAESMANMQLNADELATTANLLKLNDIADDARMVTEARIKYKSAFDNVSRLVNEQGDKTSGIRGALRSHAHDTESAIKKTAAPILMVDYLLMRRHEKDFILRENMKYVEKARGVLEDLKIHAGEIAGDRDMHLINENASAYLVTFRKLAENIESMNTEYPVMRQAAHDIERLIENTEKKVMERINILQTEALKMKTATIKFLSIFCGVIVLAGIGMAMSSVRAIIKPLNRIIDGINEGAGQVASASAQVSSSSQQLAEGASEQAASIEETSSSLEEMSSMTTQNADNAARADTLMKESNGVIKRANASMTKLIRSMEEISKASEETSMIIKTIDEIAFQTNLLALNAAVEAARAGEAGAGFAVVANEVRNLAMRAADAARNTADLIEGTVNKVKEGGNLVSATNEAFAEVASGSGKVGELVGAIATASNEQAGGIEQVNKAVNELDRVVQQNAANAEESASASEEMSAQATRMKGYVEELVTLVSGSGTDLAARQNLPVEFHDQEGRLLKSSK